MGNVDGDYDEFNAANRRAEVIDWLGGLLPEFDLPLDSSDEELCEYLIDGTALCYIADKFMPGVQEGMWGGFASDQRSNVKKFLSVVAEMGLPGFSVKDLEEDSMPHESDMYYILSMIWLVALVAYVIAFSFGIGAIPWIIMSKRQREELWKRYNGRFTKLSSVEQMR